MSGSPIYPLLKKEICDMTVLSSLKNQFYYIFFLGLLGVGLVLSEPALAASVKGVSIVGAQRIEKETILTYMELKPGDTITQDTLNKGLKSLFATGLFADVSLEEKNGTLIVHVIENPLINEIAFEGNKRISDDELLAETRLRPRQVFTRTKVQNDVTRLYQVYRRSGRFSATIDPKVIRLDQNRVNLVFEVDEGPVTKVGSIHFIGNKRFDDDRLRSEITTKEQRWYRFFNSSDRYDPDRLSYDLELLRRFYLSEGYADFRILSSSAELSEDKTSFFLTVSLEEGERYKIDNIAIDSQLRYFDATGLKDTVEFLQGDWYNAQALQDTVDKMTDKLGDMQYAFVQIRPDAQRNREEKTVDITFQISETPRVYVERIDIHGNSRTLDKVIRREMTLVEGDPFNRSKLQRSEQKIRNLGFFENIEVRTLPGSAPDKSVIDIAVSEQSTGELSVGAGYSTADGPLADLRIRERNFLGKGQEVVLAGTLAGDKTEVDLSFTEPYFLNRDLSAGVDLFHITRDLQDESSFDQARSGGSLRIGYPLSEHWRQSLRYRIERNEITDVQNDASYIIRAQEGERTTSAVSQRITYDNRDSVIFPTRGTNLWIDTEMAGLGGDAKYVSGRLGASWYYPVFDSVVFNLLGEGGAIQGIMDEDVKVNERYFLGGATLRGFERAGVGPRDTLTDDSLGGNFFYRGSAEFSFPIGLAEELGVKGHAFTDFGSLFDIDEATTSHIEDQASLRAAAGVGLSWRSPFGPIRVDFATPYLKEDYDSEEVFRFSFGTRF